MSHTSELNAEKSPPPPNTLISQPEDQNANAVSLHEKGTQAAADSASTNSRPDEIEPPSEAPQEPPPYSIYSVWEKRWIVAGAAGAAFISPLTGTVACSRP